MVPRSVVTVRHFAVTAETLWQTLMFYEEIERAPSWLLRLLLPIPAPAKRVPLDVGAELKCFYRGGYLKKRVTRFIQGLGYAFEVVEQDLPLGRGIQLTAGSYALHELAGGGTKVAVETRYLSPNRPRWLCQPIEATVCHLFHRHILSAIDRELQSRRRAQARKE